MKTWAWSEVLRTTLEKLQRWLRVIMELGLMSLSTVSDKVLMTGVCLNETSEIKIHVLNDCMYLISLSDYSIVFT